MSFEVSGPAVDRADVVLTGEALAFVELLHGRHAARRDELLERRVDKRAEVARTGRLDFLAETAEIRSGELAGRARTGRPADRRVEITGPTERKMMINALNSGAKVWLADLEDANTPHWANVIGGQVNLYDAVRGTASFTNPDGREYRLRDGRAAGDDRGAPPRLAPGRTAHHLRRPGQPWAHWSTSACTSSTMPKALLDNGSGPVLLPAQDGEPSRGAAVERRLRHRAGGARHPGRHDPGDRADRDHPGGVRDGGDPLRAARPRLRPQRRALGLPVQHHQVLPRRRPGLRPARPGGGHDDRAVHAGLHRAAGPHLPPARRVRDGRHGGLHPLAARRRDQRRRVRQGARGQDPRGRRRLRRLLGRPSRPGAGLRRRSSTRVLGTEPNQLDRLRADVHGRPRRSCSTCPASPGEVHQRGAAAQRRHRRPLPRGVALRQRRRRDRQHDGGRCDSRDLAVADLAVGARLGQARRHRRGRHGASWCAALLDETAFEDPHYADARRVFERVALDDDFATS